MKKLICSFLLTFSLIQSTLGGGKLGEAAPLVFSTFMFYSNVPISVFNGFKIGRKEPRDKLISAIGLLTGGMQMELGRKIFPKHKGSDYNAGAAYSIVSIGVGTATVFLSAWNLFLNKKTKENKTSWNIYSFPTQSNSMGIGFRISRRF